MTGPAGRRPGRVIDWLAAGLAAVLFLVPALLNRLPILYPDTVGYYHMGESALSVADNLLPATTTPGGAAKEAVAAKRVEDGVSSARSVFYGTFLVIGHLIGGTWLIAFIQSAVSVAAVWMLMGLLGFRRTALRLAAALLAGVAGAAAFAATLMPDFLAGLAILAAAVIVARWAVLRTGERAFWLLLVLAGGLSHKAILLVLVLLSCVSLLTLKLMRERLQPGLVLATAAGLILLGHMAVGVAIERVSGRPPLDPPFLLARVVADGTVKGYLDRNCAQERWVLCRYRDRMPMTENEFLWGRDPIKSIYATATPAEKSRILAESNRLAFSAILANPLDQLGRTAFNIARQLSLLGIEEYHVIPKPTQSADSALRPDLLRYSADSAMVRGTMPLKPISLLMQISYFGGALLLLLFIARRAEVDDRSLLLLAAIAVVGVVLNAAVHGAVAGVFDRYQGRVGWLIPLLALCVWLSRRASITTKAAAAR